jgi:putative Mg2+ transporter-C (MgtC) family protein
MNAVTAAAPVHSISNSFANQLDTYLLLTKLFSAWHLTLLCYLFFASVDKNTTMLTTRDMILRLIVAAVLGSIIGWERERRAWTAGLRTHMMVCLGSALVMLVSKFGFQDVLNHPGIILDPSRIAAQVVSGIGFLGAGTILFLRNEVVKGLTTAAGLWTVAAIGLASGSGMFIEAAVTTFIAFAILIVLKPIEDRFMAKNKYKILTLTLMTDTVSMQSVENILKSHRIGYSEINLKSTMSDDVEEMKIRVQKDFIKSANVLSVIEDLKKLDGVQEINFLS